MSDEPLHFKTNVQLKSIIGKDLINDDNIAILELVKNAYDANSKSTEVIFKNIKNNDDKEIDDYNSHQLAVHDKSAQLKSFTNQTSRIIIKDEGFGMDKDDITDKWLNIAYSEKKTQKKQFDRILAGAKGVGRFSCDRLGEFLNIYTRKKENNFSHLFVDWKKFEVEDNKDLLIQGIDIFYREISENDFFNLTGYIPFESGTILEISKLRSRWTWFENKIWATEKVIGLKKQLEKLINPNQAYVKTAQKSQNLFSIRLEAEEFLLEDETLSENEKINSEIENKIFEKLNFRTTSIVAEIDEEGNNIITTLQDKGVTIFKLVEKNETFINIKNATITLYYLSQYSKAYFTKQMGFRSVDFGSIYLFINGFRVPPYGEQGDDWLKLDQNKAQGYGRRLGTRELIGRIEIIDEDDKFKIVSSREGVVKNESFNQLAEDNGFFYRTFRRLEKYIVDGIGWDSIPEELKKRFGDIEKRINEDDFDVSEEVYAESNTEKFRRIYSLIHSIINTKPSNVISLYVNENIILQRVQEERLIVEKEFEKILEDFTNKEISVEVLNRVLEKKAELNQSLQKQLKDFSKYSTEEATAKAILELESLKELNNSHQISIEELLSKIKQLEEEQKGKDEEISNKEKQILFQQKLLTADLEQLLEYHHNIGISANAINDQLINLKDELTKGRNPSTQDLFDLIEDISFETNKITAITNLATAANFDADTDEIDADIEDFIRQYIGRVKMVNLKAFGGDPMKIQLSNNPPIDFDFHFKPLELAIILDNLFSNSRKAKASEIDVSFSGDKNQILISFKDNGIGIRNDVADKVFNFGYTTTSGSGMGLYHIKKMVKKYGGDIYTNRNVQNGAEFILEFIKS